MPYRALGAWIVFSSAFWIFSLWFAVGIPSVVLGWIAMAVMSVIASVLVFSGSYLLFRKGD